MQECVRSPHRIDLLVKWLKARVERDEGEKWKQWVGEDARHPLWLPGKRGVWAYRSEANGEQGFSVSDGLPSPEASYKEWWWGILHPDAGLGGSLMMSPAPDNSTDAALAGCTDQWRPYFGMLLEEMKRPNLAQLGIPLAGEGLSKRVNSSEHVSYFPESAKTRALWKKRNRIMLELEAMVRKLSEKDERRAPTPTMDEYRTNLAKLDGSGKRLSTRTVRRILKAREEGRFTQ